MVSRVVVTWCAFAHSARAARDGGGVASASIEVTHGGDVPRLLEDVFTATNLQAQDDVLWRQIAAVLPERRTHTSVSVGDVVSVDGRAFRCASVGWEPVAP